MKSQSFSKFRIDPESDRTDQAPFIDCHSHAHFAAFDVDRSEVIERASRQNVWVVNVGTQRDTSRRAVEVAHESERGLPARSAYAAASAQGAAGAKAGVYATVGLHPTHTSKSYHDEKELGGGEAAKAFTSRGEEFDYEYYKKLAQDPKVVAIGECGLDYYRVTGDEGRVVKERQIQAFLAQLKLADEIKKPLMIHCRPSGKSDDAYEDMFALLARHSLLVTLIFHFYVGSPAITKKLLDLGAYFTFGGVITFARNYDESIKMIPLNRILSETDAPYVAPEPYRGKRNEPAYVIEVVKKLAELKGVPPDEMRDRIFKNAETVFKLF